MLGTYLAKTRQGGDAKMEWILLNVALVGVLQLWPFFQLLTTLWLSQ